MNYAFERFQRPRRVSTWGIYQDIAVYFSQKMNAATTTVYKTDKRGNSSHCLEVLGVWDQKILFTLQTPVPDVANKHAGWTAKEADGSERIDRI